jgi:hypothetical protein
MVINMAKLKFGAYFWRRGNPEDIEKGRSDRILKFRAQQSNGVTVTVEVAGPKEVVDQQFAIFPLARGLPLTVEIDDTQQTIAQSLIKAQKAAEATAKKKGKQTHLDPSDPEGEGGEDDGDDPEGFDDSGEDLAGHAEALNGL